MAGGSEIKMLLITQMVLFTFLMMVMLYYVRSLGSHQENDLTTLHSLTQRLGEDIQSLASTNSKHTEVEDTKGSRRERKMDEQQKQLEGLFKRLSELRDSVQRQADDLAEKLDDHGRGLHSALRQHSDHHEEMKEEMAKHSTEHKSFKSKMAEHLDSHMNQAEAGSTSNTIALPRGVELASPPWGVQKDKNNTVTLAGRHVFTVDDEGFLRFRRKTHSVVILVGSVIQKAYVDKILENGKQTHIFGFHYDPSQVKFKADRFTLMPATLGMKSGAEDMGMPDPSPVVKLSDFVQLLREDIEIEMIHADRVRATSLIQGLGSFLHHPQRMILRLQDLPKGHKEERDERVQNTTMMGTTLKKRGWHHMCCNCQDARSFTMECYYGVRSHNTTTFANWDSDLWLHPVLTKKDGCESTYDKATGAKRDESDKSNWGVKKCRKH